MTRIKHLAMPSEMVVCIILLYHCSQCDNEFEREFRYGKEQESVKCLVCGEWGRKVRAVGCLMREEREEATW